MTDTPDTRVTGMQDNAVDSRRRTALAKLGLAALAVYSAPMVTRLDQAKAAVPSHHCPPSSPCGGVQPKK